MGRKPKNIKSLQRKKAFKASRDKVLIVCEGEETEPLYFKHLIRQLRLSSAEVQVVGKECGSSPINVVEYAISAIREEKDDPYDQVWCVFDVEIPSHKSLDGAYNTISSYTHPNKIETKLKSAISNPCFEFWYILHHKKTSQAFISKKQFLDVLKKCIPSYDKADKHIPERLYSKMGTAIANAKEVIQEKHYGDDLRKCNPSTHVHLLVEYLQEVAKR